MTTAFTWDQADYAFLKETNLRIRKGGALLFTVHGVITCVKEVYFYLFASLTSDRSTSEIFCVPLNA